YTIQKSFMHLHKIFYALKLYKHTSKLVDFVASPTGNYTNYINTFNERHQKIDDDLAELD
ncbi:hypothetical protein, partial [Lapidilactobacillus concavus]